MDSHARIKVLLGSTHLDSDAKALQHLSNSQTKNVQSNNLLLWTRAHQLHFGWVLCLLLWGEYVIIHSAKLGVVDLDVLLAVLLDSLGFSKTSGADFGVGEDYGGDLIVGELGGLELRRPEETIS